MQLIIQSASIYFVWFGKFFIAIRTASQIVKRVLGINSVSGLYQFDFVNSLPTLLPFLKLQLQDLLSQRKSAVMGEHIQAKQLKTERTLVAKSVVKQLFETSTIHGISSIYNASNALQRVFWVGIFLSVCSLLTWQVTKLVMKVNKNDVLLTSKKVSYDMLDFPCVIVSNAGPYSKSKLRDIEPTDQGSLQIESLKKILSNISALRVAELSNDLQYSCTFGGKDCQVETGIFPLIGTFYKFNCILHRTQMKPGPENGLELVLNINESNYAYIVKHGYGALVYIGDSFAAYSHFHNKGIAVAP